MLFSFILFFSLNFNPPGTIKVKSYYVDKDEVKNIHWLEFLFWKNKEVDSLQLAKITPDSANFWYLSPEKRYMPIVLISYEQAVAYCAWRSKVVSEKLGRKITYRLPTPAEWKEIAEETLNQDLRQNERELKETRKIVSKNSGQYVFREPREKKDRMRNMFDNVSEMTSEKGVAMGANNYDLSDLKSNLSRVYHYSSPKTYLGFRCIAEVE